MNYVIIAGRLGRDAETRFTADGTKVVTLTVATSSFKGGKEETIWWRCTLWGDRFDKMLPYLTKGSAVIVSGELSKPEMYTDKNGVQQIGSLELRAESVRFSPFGKPATGEQQQQPAQNQSPAQNRNSMAEVVGGGAAFAAASTMDSDEDQLPF